MKARTIVLTLVTCFVGLTLCFADNPNIGTWKLNETKSKLRPGMQKLTTVVYEAAGDDVKVTVDGVDGQGNPIHNEWTGKFDGKDYPVNGVLAIGLAPPGYALLETTGPQDWKTPPYACGQRTRGQAGLDRGRARPQGWLHSQYYG